MADESQTADSQDELTLKLWDGDESTKGELVLAWAQPLEAWVMKAFPALTEVEAEDVVAEAIRRFWEWREQYDPEKAKIQTVLFRIAKRAASEVRTGRLNWQKSRLLERELDEHMEAVLEARSHEDDDENLRARETPELHKAVTEVFASLSPLQQVIWTAYADAEAGGFELDATQLGVELGKKHDDGTPIPGGTIRVNKSRAKDRIIAELNRRGFDLKEMGYLDD